MTRLIVLEVKRIIEATPKAAWEVIADMEGYADITTEGISKVEVLGGEGVGMLRRCHDNKGNSWIETCPVWEEEHMFQFVVHTDAPDYPFPIQKLQGTWLVEPHQDGAIIKARFEYQMKFGLVGQAMNILEEKGFRRDAEILLDNWEAKALERTR